MRGTTPEQEDISSYLPEQLFWPGVSISSVGTFVVHVINAGVSSVTVRRLRPSAVGTLRPS